MSIPEPLQRIIDAFRSAPKTLRLPLLLEYAEKLPDLPPGMDGSLERVHECQTPLFVLAQVDHDGRVALYFEAPEEAPTTRGFASVVHAGLTGRTVDEVLSVPDDFFADMGLAEIISPLRLRGMGAIVRRVKRQVREAS